MYNSYSRGNPRESYLVNHWKRLNKRERAALAANVSFYNISTSPEYKLPIEFLEEFKNKIQWEYYSTLGLITEEIILNFSDRLILGLVFSRQQFPQKFFMDNMVEMQRWIPVIVRTQKLSKNAKLRLEAFYELIS